MSYKIRNIILLCFIGGLFWSCKESKTLDTSFSPLPNEGNVNITKQANFLDDRISDNSLKPEYYFYRAKNHYEQKELEPALRDIQVAIRLDSSQSRHYFWQAMIMADLGSNQEALRTALRSEEMGYESIGLDILIGRLYYESNEPNLAIRYLRRARQILPEFPTISYLYGSIYADAKDTAQAFNELKEAIRLNPNYEEAYTKVVKIYREYGMYTNALSYAKRATKHFEPTEILSFEIATTLLQQENLDSASFWYNKVLEKNPSAWRANLGIAKYLIAKKDYLQAEKYYNKALEYNPNIEGGYYQLGYIYEYYVRDLEKAIAYYKKGSRLDRANEELAQALRRATRKLENPYIPTPMPVVADSAQ